MGAEDRRHLAVLGHLLGRLEHARRLLLERVRVGQCLVELGVDIARHLELLLLAVRSPTSGYLAAAPPKTIAVNAATVIRPPAGLASGVGRSHERPTVSGLQ